MKVGEAVRGKFSKRVGIVMDVRCSKFYNLDDQFLILWSDGSRALVPKHHLMRLSCE